MAQQGLGREIPSTPGIKGTPTALISQLIRANGCELSLEFFWTLRELWTFICPREYNKGFIIQKWSHRAVNCGEQGWDSLIGQVWSHGHPWTWAGYDCGIPRTLSEGSVVLVLKGTADQCEPTALLAGAGRARHIGGRGGMGVRDRLPLSLPGQSPRLSSLTPKTKAGQ